MKFAKLFLIGLIVLAAGCGKKADEGAGAHGAFAVPVVGVKVVPQLIEEKIPVVGSLAANEVVEIKSEVEGKISEILFEEGQRVSKGDKLIVLDQVQLQAELAEAKANADIAETTFNRMNSLVGQGAVSKQEFDQAQAETATRKAQADLITARLDDMIITAPFDGVLGDRKISLGQVIAKDTLLTVLIDGDPMKINFTIPERYMGRLKEGQTVELNIAAYPERIFKGTVYFIDPQVDENTRTVLVKARMDNPDGLLHPGMFAKLNLVIDEKPQALVIPESALIPKSDQVFVFTVDAEGKAKMNLVKPGIRLAGKVEIVEGLNSGDTVITEGFQKIGPGSPVSIVPPDAEGVPDAPKAETAS